MSNRVSSILAFLLFYLSFCSALRYQHEKRGASFSSPDSRGRTSPDRPNDMFPAELILRVQDKSKGVLTGIECPVPNLSKFELLGHIMSGYGEYHCRFVPTFDPKGDRGMFDCKMVLKDTYLHAELQAIEHLLRQVASYSCRKVTAPKMAN